MKLPTPPLCNWLARYQAREHISETILAERIGWHPRRLSTLRDQALVTDRVVDLVGCRLSEPRLGSDLYPDQLDAQ